MSFKSINHFLKNTNNQEKPTTFEYPCVLKYQYLITNSFKRKK